MVERIESKNVNNKDHMKKRTSLLLFTLFGIAMNSLHAGPYDGIRDLPDTMRKQHFPVVDALPDSHKIRWYHVFGFEGGAHKKDEITEAYNNLGTIFNDANNTEYAANVHSLRHRAYNTGLRSIKIRLVKEAVKKIDVGKCAMCAFTITLVGLLTFL